MFVQHELYKNGQTVVVQQHSQLRQTTNTTAGNQQCVSLDNVCQHISSYWAKCRKHLVVEALKAFNDAVNWEGTLFQVYSLFWFKFPPTLSTANICFYLIEWTDSAARDCALSIRKHHVVCQGCEWSAA
jgi:hypothetical protein